MKFLQTHRMILGLSLVLLGFLFSFPAQAQVDCQAKRRQAEQACLIKPEIQRLPSVNERFEACRSEGEDVLAECLGGNEATTQDCQNSKKQLEITCLEEASDPPTDQEKAHCYTLVEEKYNACQQKIQSGVDHDPNAGFEIADARSLNQLGGLTIQQVIGNMIRTATGIIGSIAFAIMIFAGVMWMTAGGNSDRQHKAMSMMVWASLGVIVILSSYTIVRFLLDTYAN